MVATRRQSGKLPPPLTAPSTGDVESSDEDDPFAGYESLTDGSDSSDDDFAVKRTGTNLLFRCFIKMLIWSIAQVEKVGHLLNELKRVIDRPRRPQRVRPREWTLAASSICLSMYSSRSVKPNSCDSLTKIFLEDIRVPLAQRLA